MDFGKTLGLGADGESAGNGVGTVRRRRVVDLQLLAAGLTTAPSGPADENGDGDFTLIARGFVETFHERARLLSAHRCPADRRIEAYLESHLADLELGWKPHLPASALVLDQHGVARDLSLPADGHVFRNELVESFRLHNGVLHNPRSDRRTTAGTFHVAEGGLAIPGDKRAVPKRVFAELLRHAVDEVPEDLLALPYTLPANNDEYPGEASPGSEPARTWVSLLLRPLVCPEVPGISPRKTMEVRFFAPGSLVSNLDFVESIFGNAGDPFLPRNDAGLDVEHWIGHSGCVILAPHLTWLTKKQLGLPRFERATERQRRDRMCWKDESELYNDGVAFKVTCRTEAGVIVTLIADNYFGYCKKEVKTQISYAANLYGNVEEEHAGGALAFASYSFGDEYQTDSRKVNGRTFADVVRDYGSIMDVKPEGYGIDKLHPEVVYIPHDARASIARQQFWWKWKGREQSIAMLPGKVYLTPSGFKVRIEKHPGAPSWRIIGSSGEGTFCHKPCTVSGGGKSEISKSARDYMLYGPLFVSDLQKDLDIVEAIFNRDYADRWKSDAPTKPDYSGRSSRPILSSERSLGSVIKLLTPSREYTDEYNEWLASIPSYIYPIVFIIKRFYRADWQGKWRERFGVDIVNGFPGHELKFGQRRVVGTYLRVGLGEGGAWRTFKVRQDFAAASKIQTEDDISASLVVPGRLLSHLKKGVPTETKEGPVSFKFSENCEYRLFQRPDDAIHRGLDQQTEKDMARPDNFISNFEALSTQDAAAMVARVTEFEQFTQPMKELLRRAASPSHLSRRDDSNGDSKTSASIAEYVVCSAIPRRVDGAFTKNPRYLQIRPDLLDPISVYTAKMGVRLFRAIPLGDPVHTPVEAVLIGRRNNPADPAAGIRALAVYNPIHYQELPELFMDFICSLTGKSPSTTGAGSEGALTKSPFNAVRPTADLNTALVSFILTGLAGFSTAAGHVGPHFRVDHDISLLIPEVWCRLTPAERDPRTLIDKKQLEPIEDFEHEGHLVPASRLGYRITDRFVRAFFGRVFDNPAKVFDEAILRPETQDRKSFIDGIENIIEAQQRVARGYFEDGSIEEACPPLKALLSIMAEGSWDGMDAHHPDVRAMFTREYLLKSDWYQKRLRTKQERDIALWGRHVAYLDEFLALPTHHSEAQRLGVPERRRLAAMELERVSRPSYLDELVGTLGADPLGA